MTQDHTPSASLNPDCVQGKHRACSGTAWDDAIDDLVACACACHAAAVDAVVVELPPRAATCQSCGSVWFVLDGAAAGSHRHPHGAVTLAETGRVTAYMGIPVCAECARPWAASLRDPWRC